jgi:hypothetical protein
VHSSANLATPAKTPTHIILEQETVLRPFSLLKKSRHPAATPELAA